MAVASTLRVSCAGTNPGGESWANVFHIKENLSNTYVFSQTNVDALGALFKAFYVDWQTRRSILNILNAIAVTDLRTDPPQTLGAFLTPAAGTSGGTMLPYENSAVASLRTGLNSRRGRGRLYLTGFTETENVADATGAPEIAAATVTDVLESFDNLQDALIAFVSGVPPVATGFRLAVFSRADDESRPINLVRMDNRWDTQRRRGEELSKVFQEVILA